MTTIEVFADITCPFTHVGLKRVVALSGDDDIVVRAWPLEWVNESGLAAADVERKARVLHDQLGVDDFDGLRTDHWPASTIPALELAAAAYERDVATGLAVSLALRAALFEDGRDVADPTVLDELARDHGVTRRPMRGAVEADHADGEQRGVIGSPHYFVGDDDYFCPTLDIGHDEDDHLTARFDPAGLAEFLERIRR